MTAPIPVTAKTPIYELEYQNEGEPAFWYRAKWARMAQRLEVLLAQRAIAPPAAQDLAAVAGRVTAVEDRATVLEAAPGRLELLMTSSGVGGGNGFLVPWNAVNAGQTTPALTIAAPSNALYAFDSANRKVQVKKAGTYLVDVEVRTTVNDAAQYFVVGQYPAATTAATSWATMLGQAGQTSQYGMVRICASHRLAAGDWVGVVGNTSGLIMADSVNGVRARFALTRVGA